MEIRKVTDVGSTKELLAELELQCFQDVLGGCSPEQIIFAARTNDFEELSGVGRKKAKLISEALDKAGFIRHESEKTEPVRKLLWAIFYRHGNPILAKNNEAYERCGELTEDDLRIIDLALEQYSETLIWCRDGETLTVRQSLEEFFGLFEEEPRSRPKIAARHNTIPSCVQNAQFKALSQLASPKNPFRKELQSILEKISGVKLHMLS